jgi:hypothetical protein
VFDEQNDSHIVSLLVNKPHVTGTDKLWLENLYGKSKPGQLPLPNAKRLDRCANPFHSVLVDSDRERRSRAQAAQPYKGRFFLNGEQEEDSYCNFLLIYLK